MNNLFNNNNQLKILSFHKNNTFRKFSTLTTVSQNIPSHLRSVSFSPLRGSLTTLKSTVTEGMSLLAKENKLNYKNNSLFLLKNRFTGRIKKSDLYEKNLMLDKHLLSFFNDYLSEKIKSNQLVLKNSKRESLSRKPKIQNSEENINSYHSVLPSGALTSLPTNGQRNGWLSKFKQKHLNKKPFFSNKKLQENYQKDSTKSRAETPEAPEAPFVKRENRKTVKSRLVSASKSTKNLNYKGINTQTWRNMWTHKFTNYSSLYKPNASDKLLFSYLDEKRDNINSKYTFNNLLSSSHLITYNFKKSTKKINLNSLYKYLKSFFRSLTSLISFPVLEITPTNVKIRLFYFIIPSKTEKREHKKLHSYIRNDQKLFQEQINRRKFKDILRKYKITLFLAKWKENNIFINIPNPISIFKWVTEESLPLEIKAPDNLKVNIFDSSFATFPTDTGLESCPTNQLDNRASGEPVQIKTEIDDNSLNISRALGHTSALSENIVEEKKVVASLPDYGSTVTHSEVLLRKPNNLTALRQEKEINTHNSLIISHIREGVAEKGIDKKISKLYSRILEVVPFKKNSLSFNDSNSNSLSGLILTSPMENGIFVSSNETLKIRKKQESSYRASLNKLSELIEFISLRKGKDLKPQKTGNSLIDIANSLAFKTNREKYQASLRSSLIGINFFSLYPVRGQEVQNSSIFSTLNLKPNEPTMELEKELELISKVTPIPTLWPVLAEKLVTLPSQSPEPLDLNEINKNQEKLQKLKDQKITVPSSTLVSLNILKFNFLITILKKLFKKTIILDLVRLKYPYHESNILCQVLGLSSKNFKFRKMMQKLLYTSSFKNPKKMIRKQNFSVIPSYLSGIKVRLAGRLSTQKIVPRFTAQSYQMGSLARGKINFSDSSRITLKNKRGAYSFTVTTSHIFDD
uniref:ribosomal protein S3 n=1 Tax=Ramaria rubella TaxID=113071 RepID=UPI0022379B28|nr:ribosomal protein S3 [Ramaria rubella]UYR22260.1 ribosomal protein S3 [Ramaria rubella]